jgi:plasmid maintenance system antidote protein VapI
VAKSSTSGKTLAEQLREMIEASGLTNGKLGAAAGVPEATIWRFRKAERDITLETAGRIALALGIPPLAAPRRRPGRAAP